MYVCESIRVNMKYLQGFIYQLYLNITVLYQKNEYRKSCNKMYMYG